MPLNSHAVTDELKSYELKGLKSKTMMGSFILYFLISFHSGTIILNCLYHL